MTKAEEYITIRLSTHQEGPKLCDNNGRLFLSLYFMAELNVMGGTNVRLSYYCLLFVAFIHLLTIFE